MRSNPVDHSGLETLTLDECLRLLASVPVGRIGFDVDGEVTILPVNHAVHGQDIVFRSAPGSKLSAADGQRAVVFEADGYDPRSRTGWSVVVNGKASAVYGGGDTADLDRLGLEPWPAALDRPSWVRIRPASVTGRRIPGGGQPGRAPDRDAAAEPRVFNVLTGEATEIRTTPFGSVGTVFSGRRLELVWVSKHAEQIDDSWFRMREVDLIMVVQGRLKVEFADPRHPERVLHPGEVLVLPAEARCRAYRWPRDAQQPTIFVAAYPAPPHPLA